MWLDFSEYKIIDNGRRVGYNRDEIVLLIKEKVGIILWGKRWEKIIFKEIFREIKIK
jgi:hypothetical protein